MTNNEIGVLREPLQIKEGFTGYSNYHIYANHISIIPKNKSFEFMDAMNRLQQAKLIGNEDQIKKQNDILDELELRKTTERGKGFTEHAGMSNFWFYWNLHTGNKILKIKHFFPIYSDIRESKQTSNS